MTSINWTRAQNFIDTATDGNYKFGDQLFSGHENLLRSGTADADVQGMYNYFKPYADAYGDAYNVWSSLKGQGQGHTLTLAEQLDELAGTHIRRWDVAIQGVHEQGSSGYTALLPNRRNPYQKGSIESRMNAVSTLINSIGTQAPLATVKGQIETFYTALLTARDTQQGSVGGINMAITVLDAARLAAAEAMFRNYGSCIIKFYQTPASIANFFPVALLKSKEQNSFTDTVRPGNSTRLFKRKLAAEAKLLLINDGDVPLDFFFTDGLIESLQPGQNHITVQPHSQQTIDPALAGYTDNKRYFYAQNQDSLTDGHCVAEID